MHYEYLTQGTCSRKITFDLNDNKVTNVRFTGGCPGNLLAIPKLCEGQEADFIIDRLLGNPCGMKGTSCADQLARAIIEAKKEV